MVKWRKGLVIFGCITVLQVGSMYFINQFLQPPALPAIASTTDIGVKPAPLTVSIPDNAIEPLLSPDQQHVAYLTNDQQLVVDNLKGNVFTKNVYKVPYKKWLDDSTLLYFEQTANLSANTLQLNGNKTVQIHTWQGSKWKIIDTYFSPYIELLYIQLEDQYGYGHVYQYDAVTGIHDLPLGNIHIEKVEYYPTTDTMKIVDTSNDIWSYQSNELIRPDGVKIYVTQLTPAKTKADTLIKQPSDKKVQPKVQLPTQAATKTSTQTSTQTSKAAPTH